MDVNISIIGAGVIGLAIARKLSEDHSDVVVLERHASFGQETSSRNSEVIHSGIYYPKNSLKAVLSVKGNQMLYEFCNENNVPHQRCGKLIIAQNDAQLTELLSIRKKGEINGVQEIQLLSEKEIADLEPHIRARHALLVPSTGIIDSHSLMHKLESISYNQGTQFAYLSAVRSIRKNGKGYIIETRDNNNENFEFSTKKIINCSGLESDSIAEMVGLNHKAYKINFCKETTYSW